VAACAHHPDVWRDLGIELLGQGEISQLDVIKVNNGNDVTKCCSEILALWRQRQPSASWSQLIEALRQVKLNRIATEIEKLLVPSEKQQDKMETKKGTSSKYLHSLAWPDPFRTGRYRLEMISTHAKRVWSSFNIKLVLSP